MQYVCMHMCVYVCVYACGYMCVCVHVCICVCMCVHVMCVCVVVVVYISNQSVCLFLKTKRIPSTIWFSWFKDAHSKHAWHSSWVNRDFILGLNYKHRPVIQFQTLLFPTPGPSSSSGVSHSLDLRSLKHLRLPASPLESPHFCFCHVHQLGVSDITLYLSWELRVNTGRTAKTTRSFYFPSSPICLWADTKLFHIIVEEWMDRAEEKAGIGEMLWNKKTKFSLCGKVLIRNILGADAKTNHRIWLNKWKNSRVTCDKWFLSIKANHCGCLFGHRHVLSTILTTRPITLVSLWLKEVGTIILIIFFWEEEEEEEHKAQSS